METTLEQKEKFRDSIATITKDGRRNFIYPKKPKGKFYQSRTITSIVYLLIFFGLPFVKVNGEPLFLLNVLERKFILFGVIFWPQDFFIFGIGMVTFIVFIILFTITFGRLFCGWACPQTIFMEMVFRKVEYWIDGDASQQKLLRDMPWNGYKISKRALKAMAFFSISFIIANFFLSYLISMDQLIENIKHPSKSAGTLATLLGFTTIFFFVYWWFREQVCIVVCPYGRLQGVLLDKDSLMVAYDYVRGEPRGKFQKKEKNETEDHCKCTDCKEDGACKDIVKKLGAVQPIAVNGDCIDCHACVKVCPTGIDIRNGTQLECINCTACMDACDAIMTSIHKPRQLIRYASENSIRNGVRLRLTRRIKAYSFVLLMLIGLLVFLLATRSDLDARLMRTSGMTYTAMPDGRVANLYNLKIANKTHRNIPVQLKLDNIPGEIMFIRKDPPVIKKGDYTSLQFFVKLDRNQLQHWKTPIKISIYDSIQKIKTVSASFIGPENYQ